MRSKRLLPACTLVILSACAPQPPDAGAVAQYWPAWYDEARGRSVAARVFLPAQPAPPAPLVVFSHGVGESILSYEYLALHWATRGYAVLFVEHIGSDVDAVDWNDVTPSLIRAARDPLNWTHRARDVAFGLGQLTADPEFAARIDFTRIAAAGHSLGAHTALALVGMTFDVGDGRATQVPDARVTACLALSPQGPGLFGLTESSWDELTVPLLVCYGSLDTDVILKDVNLRRAPFDGAIHSERWLAILAGVEHETFTGRDPAFPRVSDAARQQTRIAALTTAWLDAYLRGETAARERLLGGALTAECGHCSVEFANSTP